MPVQSWYGAIGKRRSRRQFLAVDVAQDTLCRLGQVCERFRPFPGARAVLVNKPPADIFKGVFGAYGKVKGARAYLAFIGNLADPHIQEKVGYLGEAVILDATALGLSTCWVGGFFRPEAVSHQVQLKSGEQVLAVSPIGYAPAGKTLEERIMAGFATTHRRKDLAEIVHTPLSAWPPWAMAGLAAARLAPSAVNRQPWRFTVVADGVIIAVDSRWGNFGISKRLDCGIAMLHFELGARAAGVAGTWQFLFHPEVAKYTVPMGTTGK